MDARRPRPDPRLAVVGVGAAAVAASGAYVVALTLNPLPPRSLSVAMFVMTPVLAAIALGILWSRQHESVRPDLRWFNTGLTIALLAMVLQIASFPSVAPDGGLLGTTQNSNAALYLLFHAATSAGLLLGATRRSVRGRGLFLTFGVVAALALGFDLVPLPTLLTADQGFTDVLIGTEILLAALTAACAWLWLARGGVTPRPLVGWVGISQTFAVYDLALNALSEARFSAIWWSSLSMRVATYAVLAGAAVAVVLRMVRGLEHYAEAELDRREAQLRDSLGAVEQLLEDARETSATLKSHLLPRQIQDTESVEVSARYAGAGEEKEIGGDWYDTIVLPDGGLALVIGDVEGHDLAAATVMAQVRAAVHSHALEGHPPSILLGRVHQFLVQAHIERLVSLAYVQLYPQDRLMTVAIAGNPPPMLIPAHGDAPRLLDHEIGPPLGVGGHYRWTERTLLLPPDATIVMFTDGLLEREGGYDDQFAALMNVARHAATADLDELTRALIGVHAVEDDAAVLAARVTSDARAVAERLLPVRPISAPIARAWLVDVIEVWVTTGRLHDTEDLRDNSETATLLLTELLSNALRHAEESIRVSVEFLGTVLRVDVFESSHRMPRVRALGSTETSGRGLRLVESLSDDWGVTPREQGKSVWFRLDLAGGPPDEERLSSAFDLLGDGLS
ncbi:ATP-binding SpoIIE family protein phosphatase [Nocardioides szechwanensis]|uniref:ATP-binding SpoIIE family protein phosphatase n=1 Tax=Nocardioides szechwanensis TaxID=1005944 RepID=UPI000B873368|nr:ATP-binding SpoIIE family protein phosphatase [Nocardioides szechwanensis]